jgi:ubiquinone/menaquinone biosynthesis C-methylase UbiE
MSEEAPLVYNNWSDPNLASTWSANAARHTPTRPEQLDILLALLDDHFQPGKTMLDLGFGSGIVEEMIFKRIPTAQIVGIDSSPAMMALAKERLTPFPFQFIPVEYDLAKLQDLTQPGSPLPRQQYQIAFSIQALHHLSPEEMQAAYRALHTILQPGGLFILIDKVAIAKPALFPLYQTLWRRLDRLMHADQQAFEGQTYADHLDKLRDLGDRPVTLLEHLRWLGEAGFDAAPLHLHGNRAVIAAQKL